MNYDISSILSLVSRIHSQAADFLQKKMRESGLPELVSSHGFILFCLSKSDKMSMGRLSEKINRDKSTTTALVKKLESAGLVKITKDSEDCRKKLIELTEFGREYNEVTEKLSKELLETAYKDFSEEEKKHLLNLLIKMSGNL